MPHVLRFCIVFLQNCDTTPTDCVSGPWVGGWVGWVMGECWVSAPWVGWVMGECWVSGPWVGWVMGECWVSGPWVGGWVGWVMGECWCEGFLLGP